MKSFRTEDWFAVFAGLFIIVVAIFLPDYLPAMPKTLDSIQSVLGLAQMMLFLFFILVVGTRMLGRDRRNLAASYSAIFIMAFLANMIANNNTIKDLGLESVLFSVTFGLFISNVLRVPQWLKPAIQSEFYIKIGLVLLGTGIIFGEVMKAGALGLIQALVVVLSVWYFAFWVARKFKVDREMATMLASAVSICGVSAAIATCGAIKGDGKKLSYVISLVLVTAIPMMYIMPIFVEWLGLSQPVAGAWLGGTIDTTGAVVASGEFVGEEAMNYSVIIKSSQNVLLGIAAFAISIYWSYKGENRQEKPTVKILWERFPKFVLGFVAASFIFSFLLDAETAKAISKDAKNIQNFLFSIGFVCIGLETRFSDLFHQENRRPMKAFLTAQAFNIVLTLVVAWVLFGYFL